MIPQKVVRPTSDKRDSPKFAYRRWEKQHANSAPSRGVLKADVERLAEIRPGPSAPVKPVNEHEPLKRNQERNNS